jgi:chromosome segregation ATPase
MKHFSLLLIFFTLFFAVSVEAQKSNRRNGTRARKPRPAPIVPPQTSVMQPEIVSTADQDLGEGETIDSNGQIVLDPRGTNANATQPTSAARSNNPARRGQTQLSDQVRELTDKINSLEKQQRNLLNLERLSRAEERAESLRRQLTEAIDRESSLSSKIEQLTYEARTDVIERNTAVIGSLKPEEVRDTRRKAVENELNRAKEQLAQVKANRTRLETAVANADMLVEKLRARVEEELDPADRIEEAKASKDSEAKTDETAAPSEPAEPPIDN